MSICSEKMWEYAQDEYAQSEDISQGQISKWLKNREEKKYKCAADGSRRTLCKIRPSIPLFPKIEGDLLEKQKEQRKEGWRVSAKWFKKMPGN